MPRTKRKPLTPLRQLFQAKPIQARLSTRQADDKTSQKSDLTGFVLACFDFFNAKSLEDMLFSSIKRIILGPANRHLQKSLHDYKWVYDLLSLQGYLFVFLLNKIRLTSPVIGK